MAIKPLLLGVQAGWVEDAQAACPCGSITAQLPALAGRAALVLWPLRAVVSTESLWSLEDQADTPGISLLLGDLLVPKDRHGTIATEQEQQ